MSLIHSISSLDDPRIAPYRNLKDRELARQGDRFIAEGEQVVRRLLSSDFPVESVLLANRRAQEMAPPVLNRGGIPIYVLPDALVNQALGFKFHSGVIACGRRKPPEPIESLMSRLSDPTTIVVCPNTNNTENLGSLVRISAGFGVHAMILGPQCCDPFYRQSIRVSMGAVFRLNLLRSENLLEDLNRLRSQWNFQLAASVIDESAEALGSADRPDRLALLFGNEAEGLSSQDLAVCDRRITIPMQLGVDSFNVSMAAAVFLFHFCSVRSAGR